MRNRRKRAREGEESVCNCVSSFLGWVISIVTVFFCLIEISTSSLFCNISDDSIVSVFCFFSLSDDSSHETETEEDDSMFLEAVTSQVFFALDINKHVM